MDEALLGRSVDLVTPRALKPRLRHIIAHEYFGVDEEIIWDIVQNKIPLLLEQIQRILQNEESQDGSL